MPTLTVLVATDRTQRGRDDDFIFCSPGELVDIASSCQRDSGCGCRCVRCRAFTGLDSRRDTATAEVVQRPISFGDYVAAHHASLLQAGLPDGDTVRRWAGEAARDIARIAAVFPVGTVVERRGDDIQERLQ